MENRDFQEILEQIAQIHQTTPQEIRRRLQTAMDDALQNPNPAVQEMWQSIPKRGNLPTLEEFMNYLIREKKLRV